MKGCDADKWDVLDETAKECIFLNICGFIIKEDQGVTTR